MYFGPVLVTGGSRGIGRAIVERFHRAGVPVAFTYHTSERAAAALSEATGALAICADNADEEAVSAAVRLAEERFGRVRTLVNNAGISHVSLLTDMTAAEFRRLMDVHLTGAFLYCRAVLPSMIREKCGRIINISSMWGVTGASCEVAYSAAKAGLIGLTRALAQEVGPSGITVNAIAPGVIETDMNRALSAEDKAVLCEQTPLCRMGRPEEIADAVAFLASDAASFMTGAVLNISGGFITG